MLWSQSVPFEPKLETNYSQSLINDRFDPRSEFETNGRDVPIDPIDRTIARPVAKRLRAIPNQYELFGRNEFSYANVRLQLKEREVIKSRVRNKLRVKTQTFCTFCFNNNETPEHYNSHVVKDPEGKTSCSILRGYDCPICRSGGGDNGHTSRYCPLNKLQVSEYIPSVIKQRTGGAVVQK